MDSSSRNLIRLMTSTCGYSEIRNMAGQRIDMWLQNPKVGSSNLVKSAGKVVNMSLWGESVYLKSL